MSHRVPDTAVTPDREGPQQAKGAVWRVPAFTRMTTV
jgi:hypothetical protein